MIQVSNTLLRIAQQAIRIYQLTLSPDHGVFKSLFPGGTCRYSPTCSEYTHQALEEYGWGGVGMSVKRIANCHPFAAGGYDPPVKDKV